ncbi:MAG TPA: RodZ domain-containing protein [Coleofasciculaceae cyanobacterium]|jgi:cytoskeletal protein RodZ
MTNNNSPTDRQKLQDIGASLNRIRVAKNISLDAVAAKTHISKRLLAAIEAGDLQELPEPFYIQALVAKFANEIGANEIHFSVEPQSDRVVTSNLPPKNPRKYWLNFQLRSLHLYLLYIFLVIVSVKGIATLVERPVIINQTPPKSPVLTPKAEPKPDATAQVQPEATPQFVSQSNNSEAVSVGINLQERCWLKVMVDGKVAFEGVLPQGTQRQWTGKEQVTIRAGNAGGVVISFNNQQQKILGAPGQVEEITYRLN